MSCPTIILLAVLCGACAHAPDEGDVSVVEGDQGGAAKARTVRHRPYTWSDRPPHPARPCPDFARRLARFASAPREDLWSLEDTLVECEGAGAATLDLARGARDDGVRAHAVRALGFMKYAEAAPYMEELLAYPNVEVRRAAAYALSYLQRRESAPALIRAVERDEDPGVVAQAAMGLATSRAPEGLPALRSALRRDVVLRDEGARNWIIQAIGGIGADEDVCVVAPYLYDEDVSVWRVAAEAIEEITGEDFGIPDGNGVSSMSAGIPEARAWWEQNRQRYGCP